MREVYKDKDGTYKWRDIEVEEYQPTAEEMRAERVAEIEALKVELAESDYKAIKFAEGWLTADEYAPIKAERQALRDRINELERMEGESYDEE